RHIRKRRRRSAFRDLRKISKRIWNCREGNRVGSERAIRRDLRVGSNNRIRRAAVCSYPRCFFEVLRIREVVLTNQRARAQRPRRGRECFALLQQIVPRVNESECSRRAFLQVEELRERRRLL